MVAFPLDVWRHNDHPTGFDLQAVPEVRNRLSNTWSWGGKLKILATFKYQKQGEILNIIIMYYKIGNSSLLPIIISLSSMSNSIFRVSMPSSHMPRKRSIHKILKEKFNRHGF